MYPKKNYQSYIVFYIIILYLNTFLLNVNENHKIILKYIFNFLMLKILN